MNSAHWSGFEVHLIRLLSPLKYPIHFKLLIAFLSLNPSSNPIVLATYHSVHPARGETVLPRLEMKEKKRKGGEKSLPLSPFFFNLSMSMVDQVWCCQVKTDLMLCVFLSSLFGFLVTFYACSCNNLDAAAFCC